jgi:GT2 family glycosyltransferase
MRVSVVVCTYSPERFEDFVEAVESLRNQTYSPIEIVLVIDGNEDIFEDAKAQFDDDDTISIHCNDGNRGLSYSRTRGVESATGDVIAFMDDDAVAEPDWIEELVRGYEETDAIAVGGRMVPEWVAGKPDHLPEEFSWLVGANYEPRLEPWTEVRNTLGSNMSFRREVFDELGGFDEQVGLTADSQIQADETEFAIRMQEAFGKGMLYQPDAVVAHKIFEYRTEPLWLLKRAFWQGYSKRALANDRGPSVEENETAFLAHLGFEAVPGRIRGLIRDSTHEQFQQLVMLFFLTACVGKGYLYAMLVDRLPFWG